jgi:hypothetical protein
METFSKYFLIVISIIIILIAFSYGLLPKTILPAVYDFEITQISPTHIMRAIMGLYIAVAAHWLYNTYKKRYNVAYGSLLVFMYGLAAGRVISLIADGIPHWMFIFYMVCEIIFGTIAVIYLLGYKKKQVE